jgi:hypothetical protein
VAQRESRQFNPYGRADYFRIGGDTPMILFQVEPLGSLISPLVVGTPGATEQKTRLRNQESSLGMETSSVPKVGDSSRKGILRTFRPLGAASAALLSSTANRTLFVGRVVRHFGAENATHWTCVGLVLKTVVFAAIVMI